MICEQLKLTDEQAKDLDDSTEEYYNLLETNSFQSAADRLSKFRSMFNKYMIGFRMKGEAESLRAQYGFLGRLPGFTSGAGAILLISELAEALNNLEREQNSDLGPIQNLNNERDKDVL